MSERIIEIESIDPYLIYGKNDNNITIIKKKFPKTKIVCRGNEIKLFGTDEEIQRISTVFNNILVIIKHRGICTENEINDLLENRNYAQENLSSLDSVVIVYGKNGLVVKARTINQVKLVEHYKTNDLLFAIGPAGTGKTYTAVALAVKALKNKEIKRIILTRPAVEAGEKLGFLPGDLKEKLDPYLQPLYDALNDMLPDNKLHKYIEDGTIQIAPLAYMRGRTLDHAVAILDEAQNATLSQLKMFLTRMGKNSKFIVTGDITQIDLPKNITSGLILAKEILKNIKGIEFIYLDEKDVVRHPLVVKIIKAFCKENEMV